MHTSWARTNLGRLFFLISVVSDSVQPHPWDSPGKNTGVGCHFLLQCIKLKSESEVTQSCPTLWDPMDCSLPGSSIHGIFQARVLEFSIWKLFILLVSSGIYYLSIYLLLSIYCLSTIYLLSTIYQAEFLRDDPSIFMFSIQHSFVVVFLFSINLSFKFVYSINVYKRYVLVFVYCLYYFLKKFYCILECSWLTILVSCV